MTGIVYDTCHIFLSAILFFFIIYYIHSKCNSVLTQSIHILKGGNNMDDKKLELEIKILELDELERLKHMRDTLPLSPQPVVPPYPQQPPYLPQIPNPIAAPYPLPYQTGMQQLPSGQPLSQNFYAPLPAVNPFMQSCPSKKFNPYNIPDPDFEYYIRTNCNHMEYGYDGKRTILAIKHDSTAKKFYCSVCGEVFRWRFKTHILKDRSREMNDLLEKTRLSRREIVKQIKDV